MSDQTKLYEVDHPYYCEGHNYYVGAVPRWESATFVPPTETEREEARRAHVPGDHVQLSGWSEFTTPAEDFPGRPQFGKSCWATSDPDYNLLFRWDWRVPDPEDYEDGEELPGERLDLFFMLQRKGRFMVVSFPVERGEEPEIHTWLAERFKTIRAIWEPIA